MKKRTYASVWDAIEDSRETAASMRVRAELMIAVQRNVEASAETQTQAAKHLGLTQPRLNDLLRDRIEKFSLDTLVSMLARVGKQVAVKVKEPRKRHYRGTLPRYTLLHACWGKKVQSLPPLRFGI